MNCLIRRESVKSDNTEMAHISQILVPLFAFHHLKLSFKKDGTQRRYNYVYVISITNCLSKGLFMSKSQS